MLWAIFFAQSAVMTSSQSTSLELPPYTLMRRSNRYRPVRPHTLQLTRKTADEIAEYDCAVAGHVRLGL